MQQVVSKLEPDFKANTQLQLRALFVFYFVPVFFKISINVISVNSILDHGL